MFKIYTSLDYPEELDTFHPQSDTNNPGVSQLSYFEQQTGVSQLSYFDNNIRPDHSSYFFENDSKSQNDHLGNFQSSYFDNKEEKL